MTKMSKKIISIFMLLYWGQFLWIKSFLSIEISISVLIIMAGELSLVIMIEELMRNILLELCARFEFKLYD